MVEGTLADFAIKPLGSEVDEFIALQLKVSSSINKKYSDNYSFTLDKNYPDMYLILFCIEDKSTWLIDANEVNGLTQISIGNKRSKYSKNKVSDIEKSLLDIWSSSVKHSLEKLNTPIGLQQQNEQKFRKRRENYIPYITFEYPEQEALPYDFTINGLRIQEKVASRLFRRGKFQKNTYALQFCRNGGKYRKQYNKGDNDLYWINIPDTTQFLLLPENKCIENGIVYDSNLITSKLYMSVTFYTDFKLHVIHNWMYQYLYDYEKITKEQICKIFNI